MRKSSIGPDNPGRANVDVGQVRQEIGECVQVVTSMHGTGQAEGLRL